MEVNPVDATIKAFLLVSNIPYGGIGSRNSLASARENVASCSSKHKLLADLLGAMGVETQSMMGECDLRVFGSSLTPPIHINRPVRDFHNYLMVRLNGRWRRVDATFGKNEEALHLPNNLDWKGRTDCRLLFPVSNTWQVDEIFTAKTEAVASLPAAERKLREIFFNDFSRLFLGGR